MFVRGPDPWSTCTGAKGDALTPLRRLGSHGATPPLHAQRGIAGLPESWPALLPRWIGVRSYGIYLYGSDPPHPGAPAVTHLQFRAALPVDVAVIAVVVAARRTDLPRPHSGRGGGRGWC